VSEAEVQAEDFKRFLEDIIIELDIAADEILDEDKKPILYGVYNQIIHIIEMVQGEIGVLEREIEEG